MRRATRSPRVLSVAPRVPLSSTGLLPLMTTEHESNGLRWLKEASGASILAHVARQSLAGSFMFPVSSTERRSSESTRPRSRIAICFANWLFLKGSARSQTTRSRTAPRSKAWSSPSRSRRSEPGLLPDAGRFVRSCCRLLALVLGPGRSILELRFVLACLRVLSCHVAILSLRALPRRIL